MYSLYQHDITSKARLNKILLLAKNVVFRFTSFQLTNFVFVHRFVNFKLNLESTIMDSKDNQGGEGGKKMNLNPCLNVESEHCRLWPDRKFK